MTSLSKQMEEGKTPVLEASSMQEIEMPVASERIDILPVATDSSCSSVCPFSRQEHSLLASEDSSKSAKKLCGLSLLCNGYACGSFRWFGSQRPSWILHLSLCSVGIRLRGNSTSVFWIQSARGSGCSSFCAVNWLIYGFLINEALGRLLYRKAKVNGMLILSIAAFGFVLNFGFLWLAHDRSHHHHHHHHHHGCSDSNHDHGKKEQHNNTTE